MKCRIGLLLCICAALLASLVWWWHSTKHNPERLGDSIATATVPRVISRNAPPPPSQVPAPQQPPPPTLECFALNTWSIGKEFAARFELSNTEVAAVNSVLANTIAELNELELKHLTIEYESPEKSVFRIEPFFHEGEALKIKAFADLGAALPANAAAATAVQKALAQRGLMARSDFGGRATEFAVTALAPPANQRFRYEVYQREFLGPTSVFETRDPHMPSGSIVSEEVLSFTAVPERLSHLLASP